MFLSRDILPNSMEAEKAVLAGLLRYPSIRPDILSKLSASDFCYEVHRVIFEAIVSLDAENTIVDFLTVAEHPVSKKAIDEGLLEEPYVAELYSMAVLGASATGYVPMLREASRKRLLIDASRMAIEEASCAGITSDAIAKKLDNAIQSLYDVNIETSSSNKEVADIIYEEVLYPPEEEGLLSTGLHDLDRIINGFFPGDLIIIGARPGIGKSIFGITLADNLQSAGKNVMLFSLEMTRKEIIQRQVSFLSRISLQRIRYSPKTLQGVEKDAIGEAVSKIRKRKAEIFVDEDSDVTPLKMRQRIRKYQKEQGKVDCVIVDYLQILCPDEKINGNRELEVARMSNSMKAMAKQLGITVVVLCQLNRKSEDRSDKRPSLSDLRESGALEQDADKVILIYRNLAKYTGEEIPAVMDAELIVAKNRSGMTGTAVVACETRLAHFANMSNQEEY